MVVIAIIAVLLTILAPALQKAREQARQAVCQTNLKALQFATVQYFLDRKNGFPYVVSGGLYLNRLGEYIDNLDEARYCPSAFVSEDMSTTASYRWGSSKRAWMWNWGTPEPEYGSYSINGWLYSEMAWPAAEQDFPVNSQNKIDSVRADQIPGYADAVWVDAWPRDTDHVPVDFNLDGNPNYGGSMSRLIIDRHNERTNISFMDGHVQNIFLYQLWSFKWHAGFQVKSFMFRDDGSDIYQ